MSDDLVTWLRAQLDEDERIALAAFDPKHPGEWVWRTDSRTTVRTDDDAPIEPGTPGIERGPHIARWHPSRVLREVAAKRLLIAVIVVLSTPAPATSVPAAAKPYETIAQDHDTAIAGNLLRVLAAPYADRPGFRDEWGVALDLDQHRR